MQTLFRFATALLLSAYFGSSAAQAAQLDGSYTSNRGNRLVIAGSKWTYSGVGGSSSGTLVASKSSVQFYGYLQYPCNITSAALECPNVGRTWFRN